MLLDLEEETSLTLIFEEGRKLFTLIFEEGKNCWSKNERDDQRVSHLRHYLEAVPEEQLHLCDLLPATLAG